jgi:hypothetical protein
MKKTLIIGASPNPSRYAYKAANMLKRFNHEIVNVGIKKGEVAGVEIEKPDPHRYRYHNFIYWPASTGAISRLHSGNKTQAGNFQSRN